VTKSQEGGTCRNGSRSIRVRKVNKSHEGETVTTVRVRNGSSIRKINQSQEDQSVQEGE
jgi:hypothetical protein